MRPLNSEYNEGKNPRFSLEPSLFNLKKKEKKNKHIILHA